MPVNESVVKAYLESAGKNQIKLNSPEKVVIKQAETVITFIKIPYSNDYLKQVKIVEE